MPFSRWHTDGNGTRFTFSSNASVVGDSEQRFGSLLAVVHLVLAVHTLIHASVIEVVFGTL
jgi:hypothetical protein